MTTQQVTQRTRGGITRLAAVTVAGALALAVAAVSIATWHGARPGPAAEERRAAEVEGASAAALGDTASVPAQMTYFVVSSEADATILRELLAWSGGSLPTQGKPPSSSVVLVIAGTTEQADALRARITADAAHLEEVNMLPVPPAWVVVAGTDAAAIALRVISEIVPAGFIHLVDLRTS